ncbi:hypothetical protein [Mycobacterium sp. 1274761.0]|uniref:hypothetical protein n=1 Tax=Mycobacterium sp. 1274761.0 TaxID=1834077 RepID=UPI00080028F0|nr:hypothetical protein [Mycobacterium sp. 1274761.0]OBK70265.1 hypothetical protein A5651_23195 [Mycobacterium sp. 1274761.0]
MAKYATLAEAMVDNSDELAEAEMRYRLLSESFEAMPQLRANLNPALERAKAEILRLRGRGLGSLPLGCAVAVAQVPLGAAAVPSWKSLPLKEKRERRV